MATSGIENLFWQHGLQIALSIATSINSSGMSVFGVSVERMTLEIMSLLTSNTPGGITIYIECSAIPTPRQPIQIPPHTIFTKDLRCIDIFPVSGVTSWCLTSSIQCRSAFLTTSRSGLSTSWWYTKGSTSTMQYGYPCLLTATSHQNSSQMRNVLNGNGRRCRKRGSTCLEL